MGHDNSSRQRLASAMDPRSDRSDRYRCTRSGDFLVAETHDVAQSTTASRETRTGASSSASCTSSAELQFAPISRQAPAKRLR